MSTAYNDRKTDELACDGSVVDFSFAFPIASTADLQVNLIDSDGNVSTLTLDTDYTVNGTSWTSGGTITTTSTYDSGNYIQIIGATSPTQETSFPDLGNYSPRDEMDALDKLTRIAQEVKTLLSSALKVYPNLDVEYFVQTLTSGKFLRYYEGVIQSSDFSDSDIQSIIDTLEAFQGNEPYTYIGEYVGKGQENLLGLTIDPLNTSTVIAEGDTLTSAQTIRLVSGLWGIYESGSQVVVSSGVSGTVGTITDDTSYHKTMVVTVDSVDTTFDLYRKYDLPQSIVVRSGSVRTSGMQLYSADNTTDCQAAIQAAADIYSEIIIDTQVALNDELTFSGDYQTIRCDGDGFILAGPDMANSIMINFTGEYGRALNLKADNPDQVKSETDAKQTFLQAKASYFTAFGCQCWHMLDAYVVDTADPDEYEIHGCLFLNCMALECIGVGAGADDDGSTSYGEDRGDGFVDWGGCNAFVDCIAQAMDGEDCRIAFHHEGLDSSHDNSSNYDEQGGITQGCYAIGPFRRHFVIEGVHNSKVVNNYSLGGATWWSYSVIGADNVVFKNNYALWENSGSTAGAAWSPQRAPVSILNTAEQPIFDQLTIVYSDDSATTCRAAITSYDGVDPKFRNIKIDMSNNSGLCLGMETFGLSGDIEITNLVTDSCTYAIDNRNNSNTHTLTVNNINAKNTTTVAPIRSSGGATAITINGMTTSYDGTALTYALYNDSGTPRVKLRDFNCNGETEIYLYTIGGLSMRDMYFDSAAILRIGGASSGTWDDSKELTLDHRTLINMTIRWAYGVTAISDATSWLNTVGKYPGRIADISDGSYYRPYVAQGEDATDTWVPMAADTAVTPA